MERAKGKNLLARVRSGKAMKRRALRRVRRARSNIFFFLQFSPRFVLFSCCLSVYGCRIGYDVYDVIASNTPIYIGITGFARDQLNVWVVYRANQVEC